MSKLREWFDAANRPIAHDDRIVARPSGTWRSHSIDLVVLLGATTVLLVVVFRLWDQSLRVPFTYAGDSLGALRDAKTIIETGWVQTNPRLGAPFTQLMWDFPIGGDNAHFLIMRLLSIGTGDPALLINLFFLGSFYTAAVSSFVVQRFLGLGRRSAAACSLIFAFAPYHLWRGISHLYLGEYSVVPLAVLLAALAASGIWILPVKGVPWYGNACRLVGSIALLWLAGSCGPYYAIFGVICIALGGLHGLLRHRSLRPMLLSAVYVGAIGSAFVLNLTGTLLYRRRHGVNDAIVERSVQELDIFSLRLINMISPRPQSGFGFVHGIGETLSMGSSPESQYLGLIGAACFVGLLASLLSRRGLSDHHDARGLMKVLVLSFVLFGVAGGLDWLLTLVDFTEIRAWNRSSIVILFCSLTWGALTVVPAIDRRLRRRASPRARSAAAWGMATLLVVFAAIDQTTGNRPDTEPWAAVYASDGQFFAAVEAALPEGALVYLLPYRRFPEEPPTVGSGDYDLFRPYLRTQTLRWSYGGMKGRQADWEERLAPAASPDFVEQLLAIGFQGVVIDRWGFEDLGAATEQALTSETGRGLLASPDGRWAFISLAGLEAGGSAEDSALIRAEIVDRPIVQASGCYPLEQAEDSDFRWCTASGRLRVFSLQPQTPTRLIAEVRTQGAIGELTVSNGSQTTTVTIGPDPTHVDIPLVFEGDFAFVDFATDLPPVVTSDDARDLRFQLRDMHVEAEAS